MKKLILASAIAAIAANSATAATIYEDKGLTFKMKGDWQIQLRDDHKKDSKTDVEFDDLEIKNTVIYDLGNDLKAFGQLDFGFKDAADSPDEADTDSGNLEEAYVGLQYNNVKVKVGKMDLVGDEFGIEQAYENGLKEDRFDSVQTDGDDVIRVEADFGNFTAMLSRELEADNNDSANGEATDLFLSGEFGPVAVAMAYQTQQESNSDPEIDTWGLSAEFDAGFATFGMDHSTSDYSDGTPDRDITNLAATFPVTKTTKIAVGYAMEDLGTANTDRDEWYANVSYKFPAQKNVKLFAEVSKVDDDANATKYESTSVLAGMQIKF